MPSSTNATASTRYAHREDVASSVLPNDWIPCQTDTAAPTVNSPNAANIDQT